MRVLIVITSLEMGGAEQVVVGLADCLVQKGCEVKIVYLRDVKRVSPVSDKVDLLTLHMKKNSISFMLSLYRLRKIVREWKPDVIHCHQFHAIILSRLLRCLLVSPKLISSAHNTIDGGKFRSLLYKFTDPLSHINTNVSQEAVDRFVEAGAFKKHKAIVVHNSIDTVVFSFSLGKRSFLRKELGFEEHDIMFLAVGRLHGQKDYPNLLRAFCIVSDRYKNSKLLIVGDGPLREECESLVKNKGLCNKVRFLGLRSDVSSLMSASDVFVLSSAWEGFGLVVAEAMACERIVVATDSGGVKEVLGDAGFLVPPRNSDALSDAMLSALQLKPDEKNKLGRRARSRIVDLYSSQALADKWLSIYREA